MSDEWITLRVDDRILGDWPHLAWADGLTVTLSGNVAALLGSLPALSGLDRALGARMAGSAAARLRMRRLYTEIPPPASRLPFPYHWIPGPVRRLVARTIGWRQRSRVGHWAAYPAWPLDLSADFVADMAGYGVGRRPPGASVPVVLSHDIDTAEGLGTLVREFLAIEEAVGARSTNFIVPFRWRIDHGLLDEVVGRGHEIGIHGHDHSGRTPFLGAEERRERLRAACALIERYGMVGYRAPSLLRTRGLMGDLARHYRYDSSVSTSGGLFPVPNNGCASARPFPLEGLWEIPLTMPRDGSLRFLGYDPERILSLWMACTDRIAASGGIVVLLTHCERGFSGDPAMVDVYRRFVAHLAGSGRFTFLTAEQLLATLPPHSRESPFTGGDFVPHVPEGTLP